LEGRKGHGRKDGFRYAAAARRLQECQRVTSEVCAIRSCAPRFTLNSREHGSGHEDREMHERRHQPLERHCRHPFIHGRQRDHKCGNARRPRSASPPVAIRTTASTPTERAGPRRKLAWSLSAPSIGGLFAAVDTAFPVSMLDRRIQGHPSGSSLAFIGCGVAGMHDRFARCGGRPMKPGATTPHSSLEPWPWWAHLVGARSIHIDKHWPDYPLQEGGGSDERARCQGEELPEAEATRHGHSDKGRISRPVAACGPGRGRFPRRPRPPVGAIRGCTLLATPCVSADHPAARSGFRLTKMVATPSPVRG